MPELRTADGRPCDEHKRRPVPLSSEHKTWLSLPPQTVPCTLSRSFRNMAADSLTYCSLALCVLSVQFALLNGETVLGEINDDFDFDGLPGVSHEFKVEVAAGREECFFQRAAQGAKLHVSFEVLRGGDRNVDVIVRDSQLNIINAHYWKNQGIIDSEVLRDDTFAVCVDNSFSRFQGKLVYMYIVSFVMADWSKYMHEIEEINTIAANFTISLSNVDVLVQEMKKTQTQMRFNVIRDYYLIYGNNQYVMYWSIAQCVVIILVSIVQVMSVRRLFRTTNVTPTAKPRA